MQINIDLAKTKRVGLLVVPEAATLTKQITIQKISITRATQMPTPKEAELMQREGFMGLRTA